MGVPRTGSSEQTPADEWAFEDFGSLNTKVDRPSIKDNEFSWTQNWFPVDLGRLRTMYAESAVNLYSVVAPAKIVFVYSYVLNSVPYWAVFKRDGSAVQVNADTLVVTTIAGPGTFYDLARPDQLPACAQFQNKFLAIVNDIGTSNYWLWDGTNLFGAGGLSPDTTITNSGKGYTSPPAVLISGGSGVGATAAAEVKNGSVTKLTITNPGTGYVEGDTPIVTFSGGGSDNQAAATVNISLTTGGVSAIYINSGGNGYTTATKLTFSGGGGSGAEAVVTGLDNGVITSIGILKPGTGYSSAPTLAADVGTGASFICQVQAGEITGLTLISGGSGYYGNPTVTINGDGTGAVVLATVSGGAVTGFTIQSGGKNYTTATAQFTGGNRSASATIEIMPFGVAGTTIETYQNRVWIANGINLTASGPGTVANFATSVGGILTQITDASLKARIVRMAQSTGYLYIFGDSSIFVVTNVQTSAQGVTSYNLSNVDPQVGTPWRDSVVAFGRALIFANTSGVYALYGGAAEKVSAQLDGLFEKADWTALTPTGAVATMFQIRVYMLNFRTTNPITGLEQTMMCLWEGQKWFTATQLKQPTFIQTQEVNSDISAWGIDGLHLYKMYQTPTDALNKVMQTKLRKAPTYTAYKRNLRLYFAAVNHGVVENPIINVSPDTDEAIGMNYAIPLIQTDLTFIGLDDIPLTFVGTGPITWFPTPLINIDGWADSTYGRMLGYTMQTTADDLDILSFTTQFSEFSNFG